MDMSSALEGVRKPGTGRGVLDEEEEACWLEGEVGGGAEEDEAAEGSDASEFC
jgi:hypothetical protein